MNWGIIASAFGLGTFKFMFAQWIVFGANHPVDFNIVTEIFISVLAGAWTTMATCYFFSGYLMKRAKKKSQIAIKIAKENGIEYNPYPNRNTKIGVFKRWVYWRLNRTIVWTKSNVGVYGITFLTPLFLSIPLGSILCAKFYGDKKVTFPLMLLFTGLYSFGMALIMYAGL